MKIKLELVINDNGCTFLNFWDLEKGNDVVAAIIRGEIFINFQKVSLEEYINRVKKNCVMGGRREKVEGEA